MPDKDLTGVRSWTRVGDRERRKGKTGSGRVKGKKGYRRGKDKGRGIGKKQKEGKFKERDMKRGVGKEG